MAQEEQTQQNCAVPSNTTTSTISCCHAQALESGQSGTATLGAVDDGFECSICAELLLEPVVAPCGHDFCQACYEKWCQTSCSNGVLPVVCPLCRAPLPLHLGVCVRLKRTVESLYPAATKERRQEQQSSIEEPSNPRKKPCYSHCSGAAAPAGRFMVPPQPGSWGMSMVPPPGLPPHSMQAYHMGMMAMYMQYQQAWMYNRSWPRSQPQPAAHEATGTPVAEVVYHHQQQMATLAQQPAGQPTMTDTARQQTSTTEPAGTQQQQQAAESAQWQSVADVPLRLACARGILSVLRARMPRACGPQGTSPGALAIVRAVEVHLYRTAPSREAYMDALTLDDRVVEFVRTRTLAAAAAANAGAAASHDNPVADPLPPSAAPQLQEVEQPTSPAAPATTIAAVF